MHERTMWGYTKIFNKHLVYFLNFMKNYEANVLEFLENREKNVAVRDSQTTKCIDTVKICKILLLPVSSDET